MKHVPRFRIATTLLIAVIPGVAFCGEVVFASGFEDGTRLQSIQLNSAALDGTFLSTDVVVVTGVRLVSGNRTLWAQAPSGLAGEPAWPQFSGIRVFASSTDAANLPEIASMQVGSCVMIGGRVDEFDGITQLDQVFQLRIVAPAEPGCAAITPTTAVPSSVIALLAPQSSQSEPYESVLLRQVNVTVTGTLSGGDFVVTDGTTQVRVDNLVYTHPAVVGQELAFINGVLDWNQFDGTFVLLPRNAGDIQVR